MGNLSQIFTRGINFVRNNPQIIYTLFLVIAIPVAFFFTSEQFLRVATDNQDRLERSRVALLLDAIIEFLPENADSGYINTRLKALAKENETISNFEVIVPGPTATDTKQVMSYQVFASLNEKHIGKELQPDEITDILMRLARADETQAYAMGYSNYEGRYWKSVRSFKRLSGNVSDYIIVDVSMAQADALSRHNIQNAYLVLAGIIFLIIILLARQARIIDYATLYARLKEVDQMKDDFVSMAAHELRSPLTVIRGYVELVGETVGLSGESKGHLKSIDQAAVRLSALIGDILDVAKLQEGRMSFRFVAVDVSGEIGAIVDSYKKPAADKGLTISYDKSALPLVSIDIDRFRQVLVNLVGNAVKYTPNGGVVVSTNVTASMLEIRVSDTGMGISAEDQQKLFQKFYRVKNEETKLITGTGLGLWITTTMVKSMKGAISVESIKGKGTDFILSFPIIK